MIEFDPDGNVVHSWGDHALFDPRLHSCHFDADGHVWIASAPSGMVQKYTCDGEFNQVHGIAVDAQGNGYLDENRGRRGHKFKPVTP